MSLKVSSPSAFSPEYRKQTAFVIAVHIPESRRSQGVKLIRLPFRWERLQLTYTAFVHLACALICFQQCDRYRAAEMVSE